MTNNTEITDFVVVTLWYRSPEILLQRSYSTACDIWSAGCIIGEMVYGRAVFAAEDEVKQLEKIISRLGYEAIGNWPDDCIIECSHYVDFIDPQRDLNFVLRRADRKFRNLISDLLRFDPNHQMVSNVALSKISDIDKSHIKVHSNTSTAFSTPSTSKLCSHRDYELNPQNEVVNSVVRNVLDDDFGVIGVWEFGPLFVEFPPPQRWVRFGVKFSPVEIFQRNASYSAKTRHVPTIDLISFNMSWTLS